MDPRIRKFKPDLVENGSENGAKRSKVDQKWSQGEQKLEADRTRWHKMAQDSAEEPPKRPNPGYPVQPGLQNGGQNRPKSMKKLIKKSIIFLITFRIDFSSIFDRKMVEKWSKNGRKIGQKMMKKTSRRKMLKK